MKVLGKFLLTIAIVVLLLSACGGPGGGPLPGGNQPPSQPSNPTPTNAATNVSTAPTLSWSCTDPDGDALTYDVYLDTNSTPTTLLTQNSTSTSYTITQALNYNTTYYWKVVAKDGKGGVTAGPVWSFTTMSKPNQPPSQPSNPNPADGATNVSTTPTLSWTCTDPDGDTLTYDIYFGTSSTPPLVASNHTSSSYNPGTLQYNTTYYWKVVAKDGKGGETAGPIWSFTTLSLPSGSLSIKKQFQLSINGITGPIYSSPAMGPDGYVYIGAQGGLAKIDSYGNIRETTPASPVWSSPAVDWYNNTVYFTDVIGTIYRISGTQMDIWPISDYSIYASVLISDNYVYAIDLEGNVFRVSATLSSAVILKSLQREVRSSPVIFANKLFVASVDGRICAIDLSTGTTLWDKQFSGENFYGGFAIDGAGNLYIAGKKLWCLRSSDGVVNWSYDLDGQAYANPVISSGGVVYIGDITGTLHAVTTSGEPVWKKTGLGSILSSAVIGDNGVVYVCSDWIFAINPYDGSIIDCSELSNFVESNPLLHFGTIYVADEAGYFYLINALSETIDQSDESWPMFQLDWYHTGQK